MSIDSQSSEKDNEAEIYLIECAIFLIYVSDIRFATAKRELQYKFFAGLHAEIRCFTTISLKLFTRVILG